jgi:hypothetical protein
MDFTDGGDDVDKLTIVQDKKGIHFDTRIRLDTIFGVVVSLLSVVGMWYNLKAQVGELSVLAEQRYIQQQQENRVLADNASEIKQTLRDNKVELNDSIKELRQDLRRGTSTTTTQSYPREESRGNFRERTTN